MPRMPLQPCDHCCSNTSNVTSASENIKLKIMEDKLRNDFAEKEHIHEQYLTEEQVLEKHYTKEETDGAIQKAAIEGKVDLTGYAKEEWVESKKYLTEHQDISGKQDNIEDLEEIREGANLGKTALQEVPAEYITEEELEAKQYLTEHQDISHLAEKDHVHDQYLTEHQSLEGYAKESFVEQKVTELVDSAPEALNTLNELAVAINNHEDAYDALLETVGSKAEKEHIHDQYLTEDSETITGLYNEILAANRAANNAQSIAGDAHNTAYMAITHSEVAVSTAETATYTANTAKSTAATAQAVAEVAKSTADTAQAVAEAAISTANQANAGITEVNQRIDNLNIPSIEGLASEEFVINKIAEAELNDKDVDISGLASKEELATKAEKEHTHSYNDLSDLPEIPSIEGLASEQFVSDEIAKIELKEGPQGPQGEPGPQGPKGDSAHISMTRDESGVVINYWDIDSTGTAYIYDGKDGEQGPQGEAGKSAFELAKANGYEGESEAEWLESLRGEQGTQGEKGEPGYTPIKDVDYFDGKDGENGQSAYEIWLAADNTGTEDDFLASLKGDKGDDGLTTQIKVNEVIYNVDENGLIELPKFVTPDELHDPYDDTEIKSEITELDQKIEKNTVLYNEYVDNAIANIEIPEAELYKVDFNNPNYADAKAAYESGKLLVLINAAPDINSYAVMNYVSEKYITFTKFLTSRSEAYGSFNTYYLSPANTWEVSKEVKLNKVEANPSEDSTGELNKVRIGKEIFTIPQAPAKVSELENDANYTDVEKVLELIENKANTKIGIDFTPNITVGYLGPNTPITADMTIGQIIHKMLYCEHDWLPSTCGEPYFCDLCGHNHPTLITEHNPVSYGEDIDATCTYPGSTVGVKCYDCEKILVPSETIPQLPHEPSEPYLELEPTCTEAGESVIRCNNCGEYIDRSSVPALGHDWLAWSTVVEPTCETAGYRERHCDRCGVSEPEELPALGHNYTSEVTLEPTCEEDGIRTYTCSNECGESYTEAISKLGHKQAIREENRTEPDCINDGSYEKVTYCTECNEVLNRETIVLSALGHNLGEWKVITEAQVGVPGLKQRECSRCDYVETEEIPALEPEEPTELKYLAGTFGNTDDLQEWPEPFINDWSEEEQEEISMHYVNNMIEYSVASEEDLVGRHGFDITTPFVKESNSLAAYGEVSEDPYTTRPAIVLPIGYEVTAWNTDVDNSSLSECTVYKYDLVDGRTVYYAGGFTQQTGAMNTHYLTIVKN